MGKRDEDDVVEAVAEAAEPKTNPKLPAQSLTNSTFAQRAKAQNKRVQPEQAESK